MDWMKHLFGGAVWLVLCRTQTHHNAYFGINTDWSLFCFSQVNKKIIP